MLGAAAALAAGCTGSGGGTGGEWIDWLGRLHALTVAFPIALLVAAGLAEFLFLSTRREEFAHAARFCLWSGAAGAIVAGTLGWLNAGWNWRFDGGLAGLAVHRWLGTVALLWSILLVFLLHRTEQRPGNRPRGIYRTALLVGVVLVIVTAHFGGMIVFGPGYFAPPG